MKKRIFSFLLAFVMLVGMLPVHAFAAENTATISNAYCTITPAMEDYAVGTVKYNGEFTGLADIPKYTVQIPNGTQKVNLKVGNSYGLSFYDGVHFYYIELTYDTGNAWYNGGYATEIPNFTQVSDTESAIELDVADLISGGKLFGVIDSGFYVLYALEFVYAASDEPIVAVTEVSLDKTSLAMNTGETATLTATVLPENATNKSVSWSSSNPDVASVENGVVTAKSGGSATITALAGTEKATCEVTVEEPITKLSIYPFLTDEYTVEVDDEVDIVACCTPKTTTQNTVIYTSSDPSVVSVAKEEATPYDAHGHVTNKVKANKVGSATITVTAKANPAIKDSVTVNVVDCIHKETETSYARVTNTETHTVTVTCKECTEQISKTTTACADKNTDGACDLCGGVICLHPNQTTTYNRVADAEKHTITVTCDDCKKTIGTPTTESCADKTPKDGKCDLCGGDVEDTSASEPTLVDGVYQIGTADQLLWFAKQVNDGQKSLSALLTADIDLSGKTWTPMSGFAGTFDGGNKTIKNLTGSQGLFASVIGASDAKRAEVKNVTVEGSVNGATKVGGIAGSAHWANFSNCINRVNISGTSNIAGIVGYSMQSASTGSFITLTNCGNEGSITGTGVAVAGVLGYAKGSAVLVGCYNTGNISGVASGYTNGATGGLIGYVQGFSKASSLTDCYNTGAINGNGYYAGGLIGSMYNGVTATNCYNAGTVTGGSGKIGAIAGVAYNASTSKAVNCYYLDTSCAAAATNKPAAVNAGTTAKTDAEMKDAAIVTLLGASFKQGSTYPVLAWETVATGAVSYAVTAPDAEGITFEGSPMAYSTESYEFTISINDYYRANSNFAVRINNGAPLTAKSVEGKAYTYEVAEPSEDMVITVEGVESTATLIWSGSGKPFSTGYVSNIKIYDVTVVDTKVDGTTITVTLAADTSLTKPIRFTADVGGQSAGQVSVTPGKDFIKNLSAGVLEQTITASFVGYSTSWNIKLQVEGVEVQYADVEKPVSSQYTITGTDKAPIGGDYSFTLKLASRYFATEDFAVKANGVELDLVNGEYTVTNVAGNIKITVEGVAMRTFSNITAGGETISAELQGLYTVQQGTYGSDSTSPMGNVPYYIVNVPYGTQTVKVTYPSYWHPSSAGSQGAIIGWSYNPITLVNGEPNKGTYTTYGDVAYTTNEDGTYTVEISVNNYLKENNKGFSLLDNSLGFVDVLTFVVEDCTHPAANVKTTYAAAGNNTHTAIQTCLICNTQVGSLTENCIDTNPKDDKCDLCKGDSTIAVVKITLNKETAQLEAGATLQLTAEILPDNATDKTITWTSSNESVATVDATGKVSAVAVGEAVITAKAGDQEDRCTITVTEVVKRVNVYLSLSTNDQYMVAPGTGSVMALQKIEVPWFSLEPYGLQEYTYQEGEVTVLHLYIYATERFYCSLSAEEAGKGYLYEEGLLRELLLTDQGPGSMYLKSFWGHDENLRYFYNYVYPAIDGWGTTADRLILKDNDVITLGHHSYWQAHEDSGNGFLYFTADEEKLVTTTATQGNILNMQLMRSSGGMGGANNHTPVANTDVYYVSADALSSGNITNWTKLSKTDASGNLKVRISLDAGTYYLAVAGQAGIEAPQKIVSSPGAVILTVLDGEAGDAVQDVIDLIDNIGTVSLESETAILAARDAYNTLGEEQKAAVTNYTKLTDAEASLTQLKQAKADQDAADAVTVKINAIGEVTLNSKAAIEAARTAYDALTDAQKALVNADIVKKLTDAEADYANLVAGEADKNAAKAVEEKIEAIGTVTLDSETKIKAAREAYDTLTDVQKLLVDNYEALIAAEAKLAEQKDETAANVVEEKIAAIGTVTLDSEAKIKAARDAYSALTDAQKTLVENLAVLEAAEETLELLKLAGTDVANIYKATGDYLAGLSTPGVGSTNGEWRVLGLARADRAVSDAYYDAVVRYVQENIDTNGRLHANKSTENSRLIVALTALGKDVTNVGGYDLLSGLNDMEYIGNQGINGNIWALIAFDTHDYEIPAGDVTREKLVQSIVEKQCSDGGWSLGGRTGDPDITGMTLQALAPYYSSNSGVKAAVDKALVWLSGIQGKDGTFAGSEGITSESLAQVITGLTALGINPETDSRFVKNGVSAMDALSKFYLVDGTFEHGLGSGRNMMATEQAYYALVSYYRLLQGKTSLYDMSDVTLQTAAKDREAATAVEEKINAIGTVTKDSGDKITAARKAYDALTDAQKLLVENYKTLTDAETKYAELVKTAEDEAAAKVVADKIDAIGTVSLNSEETIKAARKAYDALSNVQKALVDNYHKLTAAEQKLVALKDETAANAVETLIDAIGTVTKDSETKIKAARKAYDALTDAQKLLVENYEILTAAEKALKELNSTAEVTFTLLGCTEHGTGKVHTLADGNLSTWIAAKTYKVEPGTVVKEVLEKALTEAGLTWKNPTGNYVESINGIGEFTNGSNSGWMYTLNGKHPNLGVAEQTVKSGDVIVFHYTDDYTKEEGNQGFADRDEAAAKVVEELIDTIGEVTLDSKDKIDAARKAYAALTSTQKQKVGNYTKLTDAEAKYEELMKAYDEEKADAVEALINQIEDEVTLDSEAKITAARDAYEALTAEQKKLVDNYKKLTDAQYALALLKANEQDQKAAKTVETLIDAIGTVTLDSEAKIIDARDAYNKLTAVQKDLVRNIAQLENAETKLAELKDETAANVVEEKIAAIGTVTLDSEAKIKAAREAYNALTDAQKALVENLTVLEAAEETLELLKLAGTDIANIYKTTGEYLAGLSAPGVGSTNGEWRVLGLARAGKPIADSYYTAVVRYIEENMDENDRLHSAKSSENSRLIVALTAIGKDVTNVEGYDLLSGLNDMDYIGNQGINGTIWALIAFDAHDYDIPSGNVTREKLVQAILNAQLPGGGWALSGAVGDPDMTGMALQALAPYYTKADVKKAVDKALTWLSGIQNKDGTFTGSEGTTSESLAQVITGLTALGINPETDSRFVKNGVSAVDALSQFYVDGGFKHSLTGDRNMMATEQAYYALVSYYRLLQGKTSLYDMSDVTLQTAAKDREAATAVEEKINAIGTVTKDSGDKITAARNAYDALTDSQKALVGNYQKLLDAETAYAQLVKTAEDEIAAKVVADKIEAIGTVTLDSESKIKEARTAYDKLTAVQKALVSNYDKLTAAEQKLLDLKDGAIADTVETLIDAIGVVTKNSGEKIKAAREAYDKLTDAQKKLVENYKTLTDAESKFKELNSTAEVSFTLLGCYKHDSNVTHTLAGGNLRTWIAKKTYKVEPGATVKDVLEKALKEAGMSHRNPTGNYVESINGIGEFTNGSNSGWMYTLNGVHPNLGVAEQPVKNGDVIVFHYTDDYTKEASGQGFADRDEGAAEKVENLIDAIGTVTLNSKDKIDAARKAYDALSYTQKQKVENYKKLTAAEAKYAELKKADDEKKADAVEALIGKIDAKITLKSETAITAAREAYDALTADQKKLVENYKKLTDAEYDFALLKADEKDKEAAETVQKLIDAIGTVTLDSEETIKTARDAYDKLTDLQKTLVKNYGALENAEARLAELKNLTDVENVYKATGDYLETLGTPAPGSVGGEWMVIGLLRSGRELKDADGYYDAVVKFVQENIDENGRLHNAKSTENSRIILALTAMGKDVTDVGGYNLLTGLNDMDYVQKQGINGPIWALIALDSGNYPAPDGDVTRESLLQVILDAQLADGGWALSGALSDPDMTGMALQALAPYYKTNAQVEAVVDAALETLSMMQAADGSFASIDGSSSESVAQVLAALSALGIDADTDSRFIKNGTSALDALCAFFVEGGGFKHIPEGKLDGMATEQSYYALTAYFRMLEGKTNLFDMTDVMDVRADKVEEEPAVTEPVQTEPAPTEPAEMPVEEGRSFPWWLVVVIVLLAGAIVVLVIISKSKKRSNVR